MCIYMQCMYACMCIYIYIYIERERERYVWYIHTVVVIYVLYRNAAHCVLQHRGILVSVRRGSRADGDSGDAAGLIQQFHRRVFLIIILTFRNDMLVQYGKFNYWFVQAWLGATLIKPLGQHVLQRLLQRTESIECDFFVSESVDSA